MKVQCAFSDPKIADKNMAELEVRVEYLREMFGVGLVLARDTFYDPAVTLWLGKREARRLAALLTAQADWADAEEADFLRKMEAEEAAADIGARPATADAGRN
jgi:hypothetical protein